MRLGRFRIRPTRRRGRHLVLVLVLVVVAAVAGAAALRVGLTFAQVRKEAVGCMSDIGDNLLRSEKLYSVRISTQYLQRTAKDN